MTINSSRRYPIAFLLKLLTGCCLLGLLIWYFGIQAVVENIVSYNPVAFIILIFTTLFGFLLAGCGLICLGRSIAPEMPWWKAMRGVLGTLSLSLFVPGRAGDLALPLYWKKFMLPGECMALVFLDKIVSTFWVIIFGGIGLLMIYNRAIFLLVPLGMLFSVAFLLNMLRYPKTRRLAMAIMPEKVYKYLEGSINAFRTIAKSGKKNLIYLFFLTALRFFVYGVAFWVSLWGLGIHAPFFYSVFVMSVAQYTSFVPISIMGLGTVEAVCVYALNFVNIMPDQILAALVVGRIITLGWLALFFIKFNVNKGIDTVVRSKF